MVDLRELLDLYECRCECGTPLVVSEKDARRIENLLWESAQCPLYDTHPFHVEELAREDAAFERANKERE